MPIVELPRPGGESRLLKILFGTLAALFVLGISISTILSATRASEMSQKLEELTLSANKSASASASNIDLRNVSDELGAVSERVDVVSESVALLTEAVSIKGALIRRILDRIRFKNGKNYPRYQSITIYAGESHNFYLLREEMNFTSAERTCKLMGCHILDPDNGKGEIDLMEERLGLILAESETFFFDGKGGSHCHTKTVGGNVWRSRVLVSEGCTTVTNGICQCRVSSR